MTGLSTGVIADILEGAHPENPILQVLTMKRIPTGAQERFRLMVSDGEWSSCCAMLATHLNSKVIKGEITTNCIIQMNRYVCNTVSDNKKVLIILELTVEQTGENVGLPLGKPVNFDAKKTRAEQQQQPKQQQRSQPYVPTPSMKATGGTPQRNPLGENNTFNEGISPQRTPTGGNVHPICSLTPYQNKWTVCARISNKSDIRTWSNSRGEGKLFSMDLLDESGEIRATAFNEQVDKFYDAMEVHKVYFISSAVLKPINRKFCNLKNDYEMTFNKMTEVTPCLEVTSIPAMQFEFVPFDQLENKEKDSIIDVIGVCKEAQDVSTVLMKSNGKELKKRDLQILDETKREVRFTLWGSQAENFDGSQQPIIAVKGAKVSDYNGRCLSAIASSSIQINPDIREAHKLKGWFDNVGQSIESVNLSNQRGDFGGGYFPPKTFGEAMAEKLGSIDIGYYRNKAYISVIRHDTSLYSSCPAENCTKKVVDQNNGMYRCEKCSREYTTFKWRLLLQMNLIDSTNCVWATAFHDTAESILGTSAENLGNLKETDSDAFTKFFINATFKEYFFNLRVKMESYNDEGKLKTVVSACKPVDVKEHNKHLISEIRKLSALSYEDY